MGQIVFLGIKLYNQYVLKLKKKIIFSVSLIVGVLLIFILTDAYRIFLIPLESGEKIEKNFGDVILILGGGLRKGSRIGYSTEERLIEAVRFYNEKKRHILLSDGSLYRKSPAIKMMKQFLLNQGVSEDYIIMEGKSQTTYENFTFTKNIISEMGFKEVIVCTSPYHQKRAELIIAYLGYDNYRVASMKDSEVFTASSTGQRFRNMWLIFREYSGIVKFSILRR